MSWIVQTAFPVFVLAALAWVLPGLFARQFPDTRAGIAGALAMSGAVLILVSAGLFVGLYLLGGLAPAAMTDDPWGAIRHFLGLGLSPAIVWAPVLALSGLTRAHEMEARRGREMAARDAGGIAGKGRAE